MGSQSGTHGTLDTYIRLGFETPSLSWTLWGRVTEAHQALDDGGPRRLDPRYKIKMYITVSASKETTPRKPVARADSGRLGSRPGRWV